MKQIIELLIYIDENKIAYNIESEIPFCPDHREGAAHLFGEIDLAIEYGLIDEYDHSRLQRKIIETSFACKITDEIYIYERDNKTFQKAYVVENGLSQKYVLVSELITPLEALCENCIGGVWYVVSWQNFTKVISNENMSYRKI